MSIKLEFSKYAKSYSELNIIQEKVANKLIRKVLNKPKVILDLGCGSGALCEKIDWDFSKFIAVDFSQDMLDIHKKSQNIECINYDFNERKLFEELSKYKFDYIISSSALQWADSLETIFKNISELRSPIAFAIFTSNTFKTLHKKADIKSPLQDAKTIKTLQKKYFKTEFEILNYRLEFESTKDMFRYIKQSGVSGSKKLLSYKQAKDIINSYPVNYLEFEVAFIYSI